MEHLLLALFEQKDGMVQQVLTQLAIDRYALVQGTVHLAETYPRVQAAARKQTFLAPRLRNLLQVAHQEAQRLGDKFISTEHLFLAMFADRDNPLVGFLQTCGLSHDRVYQEIEQMRKAALPPQ
jgi:ATP-dependent Clp protease ATP-binding subunit ClpA